jgi:hypothetical protein
MTTKAGLRNSDGWIETPPSEIQRRAPLTSTPTKRTATISTSATASMITRQPPHLPRVEEGDRSIAERRDHEDDLARGEMEAVEPDALGDRRARREGQHDAEPISDRKAARNQRSIVHHQVATRAD